MATVSRRIAEKCVQEWEDGTEDPDEPTLIKIVKYRNSFNGEESFGLVFQGEDPMRYEESPYCHDPEMWWSRFTGRTPGVE